MELAPFFTKFYAFFKKYFSEHMEDNKPSGLSPQLPALLKALHF